MLNTPPHQQFLILAVYPAVARLPKIILPTLGIYLGTVRNRFGPLDTARNCFVPLGTCLGVLCTFGELYVPTHTGVALVYSAWYTIHSDIYFLCKFLPQFSVVMHGHTSSKPQ